MVKTIPIDWGLAKTIPNLWGLFSPIDWGLFSPRFVCFYFLLVCVLLKKLVDIVYFHESLEGVEAFGQKHNRLDCGVTWIQIQPMALRLRVR